MSLNFDFVAIDSIRLDFFDKEKYDLVDFVKWVLVQEDQRLSKENYENYIVEQEQTNNQPNQ